MNIGYIRVSDKSQNPDRQIEKMKEIGIEERFIFVDRQSGKDFSRPAYQSMKQVLREGDLLYLDALDRLGRNYDGIINEWKDMTRNIGADIIVLEQESLFDSRKFREMGELGKLMEDQFLSLPSYVAAQEREKIRTRQQEGIAIARRKGVRLGRPRVEMTQEFVDVIGRWTHGEMTAREAMHICNMSPSTFYRRVDELKGSHEHQDILVSET